MWQHNLDDRTFIRKQLKRGSCIALSNRTQDSIVYRFFYKHPSIAWLQKECFPLPNDIWTLICEHYTPSEWIDNYTICRTTDDLKMLIQHLWQCTHLEVKELKCCGTILFQGSKIFVADVNFPRKFSSWISPIFFLAGNNINFFHSHWFHLPHFYHETREEAAIKTKKRQITDLRQSVRKLQKACSINDAFIRWKQ